ncbi:SspB-related isopeptide-forming adhesin [Ligilactobacillus salivarius]|nr:SspB-related isopeptide-forming adhesin [Ligilactobacillus salivarius]MDV9168258.1 LPXTG cell wall anchor domain-containing protein [Ligilactobacillus salivarius]
MGKNLPNVSYVSAGDGMTFDKGTLQSFSQNELNSILNNPKVDPGLKNYIASKAYGSLYKIAQGTTWKYNNAFTDTKTGKSVDLKVTVQGLGLDYSGRYGLPPMIMVGEKYIGSDVAGIGAVKYGLTFLEHGTNTPINITSLIGVGDVDAKQSVAVYNAVSALRGSENKDYSGNGYLGSINTNGVDDFSEGKNTQYQSWFLVPNSSAVSYVFSAADPAWGNDAPDGSGFMGFYHQNLGGIPLPIKSTPPTPPTVHYHHTNVALEKPTPIDVTYHYDRMNPASIEDRTDISYHYNKISVPIPNPTKKADKEGKTLIAGDESTQHISQYTGVNQKLDKFAVGDAIQYTNDGRLPVSFDLSKWTVTTSNGTNVTAQGKFTQYDKTFEGKKYHVVSWSPTNVSSLKDNETYTLNTILKTLNDGITDGEIDRAVGGGDGVTFGEAHGYDEFNPTTDKAWKEGSQTVNGKIEINEDIAHAKVTMTMPDPAKLANKLSNVAITDNYSKFANLVTVTGANVYENERNATSDYTIVNNNKVVTATRKNPATANGGTVSLVVDFKVNPDVPSGTKLVNSGSGTINTQTVPTPDAQIVTFTQTPTKHWVEGSQVVDGKTYINDDIVTTQVDMNLPDPKALAKTLSYVSVGDNYRDFADKTVLQSYKVLENGTDVTSQYTITNQGGILQAVRKNAATAPGGKVSLIATFAINHDVKSGTKLTNRGFGRINNHTVDTNTPQIVTFKQDTSKHWVEGSQVVDDKTYINEDMVHGQVTMTLPNKDSLAKSLTDVALVDDYSDYANKVSYVNAQVFENNTDVTSQYNITNAGNKITATRKNPGATPSGSVRLVANFKLNSNLPSGTKLINRGSGRINNNTVNTNEAKILTYVQSTDKHWVEGSQKVDGKTYIDGDTIHGQVTMTLPDKNTLAKALSTVQVIDDYSKFAKMVDYKSAQVLENGKDVTSEYNISNVYGQVVATRKNATATPSGNVTLNVTWTIHKDVPSGTQLVNSGSGRINSHTVPTPDRNIVTYKQDGLKDWINAQGQIVNGKTVIDNDTVHAKLVMTLPDPKTLATPLTKVQLDDNYSKFAGLVDYVSSQVLENGTDVTSQYNITNANDHVIATRKDASKTPGGKVEFRVNFKIHTDVPSGTTLMNSGEVTLNSETVPTPTPNIVTYKPDTDKHWVLDNNVTDNKIYFSGDKAVAQVSVDLPDASKLATPLSKLVLVDNYSDFADKVKLDSAKVLENGKDVTSEYDLTNKDGKVFATRKDAAKTPSGKAVLVTTFTINNGIENATALHNKGSVTVDSITDEVPDTPIVVFTPKAHKDVELGGDVKGDTENSVDGSLILNGSVVTYPITTSDLPAERAEDITKRVVKDTLDKNAEFVGFKAWIENDKGELEDVTSHYKLDKNGQDLTFTEDSYLLGLYNKDKSKQTHTPIIDLVVKVKGDAQKINNKATVLTNDNVTETNEVSVDTPAKPTPTKVDKNEKGVNIDGKNVLPGSVNNYELTMDLAKFKGIKVTDQDLAKGFYFVDDYPEEALDVDPQTFTYKTVDGKTVKGLSAKVYQSLSEVSENVATALKANGITPNGAFVLISADDPAQFFKDYVETGTNIVVNAPMKVKEGFAGKYQNKAWQLTFGQGEATDIVSNNVPKIDPKKDIVISADNRTSLNNHTIELGQNFDYLLKGGILDKDQGHDIYEYKWVDDYDENHDQYNGQFIAPLTVDVTLKDGTVLKAGTDISNHVSQNIDTKTGSVEFSVDKDFLDKVDFDKSGFAADILMSVKRIKAGEVDNTYTNIINGQKFGSNTVHSTTPEPKEPETPATPKTHETPSVPVAQTQTPATPQPVKMVTSTPAPKAPESPALPQTGEANDTLAEEVVGFAAIVAALGMAGTSLKKRED